MEIDWYLVLEIIVENMGPFKYLVGVIIGMHLFTTIATILFKIIDGNESLSSCEELEDIEYEEVVEDCEADLTDFEFVENDSVIKYY